MSDSDHRHRLPDCLPYLAIPTMLVLCPGPWSPSSTVPGPCASRAGRTAERTHRELFPRWTPGSAISGFIDSIQQHDHREYHPPILIVCSAGGVSLGPGKEEYPPWTVLAGSSRICVQPGVAAVDGVLSGDLLVSSGVSGDNRK